ncbi:ALF repeat-containing protein [Streptomyces sp. ZYX-F-203]
MSGEDAAVETFLKGGFRTAVREDLRVAVSTVMAHGGQGVKREAAAALEADSDFALRVFLSGGQFTAQEEDERVQVTSILFSASPQVREYAERALDDGSPRAIRWFLETGQHIARARDEESATIQQLVKTVEAEGRRAGRKTDEAIELSAQAVEATGKAKAAALEAKAEAEAAEQDVQLSARAANKAAQAASRRAVAVAVAAAAASAGRAAARAYRAAIAASKDASQASAARAAAQDAKTMVNFMRSVALKAEVAAVAAVQADRAGEAAASSAFNAAAARASADAAVAAGAAKSESAAARQAAATRATQAAARSRSLAGQSAAAEEATDHAGEAVDYANRSTAAAKAADAVVKAREVEQAARAAESVSLVKETDEAIETARLEASAETGELERVNRERTQEARLSEEIRGFISSAESALQGGRTTEAVAAGRKAAVQLIDRSGTWTREAAEFALAGSDEDVVHWIEADRVIALRQDNAENVAAIASVSTANVAKAAAEILKTGDPAQAPDSATVPINPDKNGVPEGAESWLTGDGPNSQCFGPDDEFTGAYRDHENTKETIDFLADRTRTGNYELGYTYLYDYSLSGFEGAGKYIQDYRTLSTAGLTGNLACTFLGSHYVRMTPIRENADGSVVWQYTAFNESDIESATHPPVIGYTDWWSDNVGSFIEDVVGDSGPMSPKTQVIEFNVTLGP